MAISEEPEGRASPVDVASASLVDVAEFIDEQPVGGFQLRLLLTCAAVLFLDGFDTQAIGYVAPAIAKEWGLTKGALGPVFSAGLFGLMIGALLFGPLADRIGRKKIIVFSTIAFGIGTLITAFVHGVDMLLTMRFLTGLGLGGAMPNAVAMTSEFNPRRRRATMVMIMFCGFSVGAALGGFLAAALIPKFGWRSVFIVGGAAPLLLAPILMLRLPESVRFLVLTGRAHRRVAELLASISPKTLFASATQFVVREPELTGIPVVHLFKSGRTLVTLLLWVVFFMSLLDLYFLSNWLPTVLNDLGASVSEAAVIGSMLQVGGIVGTFALGSIIDRFSFRALALVYFIAVFAVGAIGQLGHSAVLVTVAIFAAGFCIVGGQIAANALAAGFYPTAVRATGVGWALGIGRVGSIVGPLVGGALLSMKWSAADVFITAAVAALCAALAAFSLSRLVAAGGGGQEGRADQVSPFHDTLHPVTTART
ncbi:MFS transporter [Bradyrhizobium canariense]|uniref:MFS transporter, AAHS family, 4-hydroxybenzoate transporter n=1 Tax=Bradyrhizobium canariense TaxID=255045 RepID=A0A1H1X421_9BRAD|nr:MFS transporter [Bradyrhizobium canariense]SDT03386.1 MFS transporter, AAHS family, 4-hydroxybenzoate transporter [Bradyrhizobium canariense]